MKKTKLVISWIFVLLLMILIFYFSSQKAESSSETSGGFAELLAKILHSDFENLSEKVKNEILNDCQFIVRKTAHFSVYAFLGILTFIACKISDFKRYRLISAIICLVYAVSDEIHQYFVEGRSCEFRDVLIDFLGAISGIIGISILLLLCKKIKGKISKNY